MICGVEMQRTVARVVFGASLVMCVAAPSPAQQTTRSDPVDIRLFLQAGGRDADLATEALRQIGAQWHDGYASIIWDLASFSRPPLRGLLRFIQLVRFLEEHTGQRFGPALEQWRAWIWAQPYEPHPDYAVFKGQLYARIDPRFVEFFPHGVTSGIRLDEVEPGGVTVNGIAPLEYPEWLNAAEADYLSDDYIVFGIALNGEARAYPKRILARHEMALDRLGDIELTIVYCTLCGTVIPFESVVDGQHLTFGTSGLLYRSNKLMFDHETRSLWNTFEGVPVVGTLVGQGLRLTPRAVVTTTWGEWRRMHPATTVLSLNTGYVTDYSEGAAYRSYFGTDALMFSVSKTDDRLKNKEEVLVMRLQDGTTVGRPLAITARFLSRNRVFSLSGAGRGLVVVTSEHGANRVYDAQGVGLTRHLDEQRVADDAGRVWSITEGALVLEGDPRVRLPRLPAQRAFWFGWYAQFPNTELIQ